MLNCYGAKQLTTEQFFIACVSSEQLKIQHSKFNIAVGINSQLNNSSSHA